MSMNPLEPASFHHRTEKLSTGRSYHFVDQIPANFQPGRTPTLLCLHGFPDLWYGWRYQIGPWTRKGYRVVVPDMLGYGGTDKPPRPLEYSTKRLCADLAALLDLLQVDKAVIIGHDWGSFTAGRFALWHPERLLCLVMLSVPFTPPTSQYVPLEDVVKRAPQFGYQLYFAEDNSTREIEDNLSAFLSIIFRKAGSQASANFLGKVNIRDLILKGKGRGSTSETVLDDKEFQYYFSQLKRGMNGPLSYYRTTQFRFEEEQTASLLNYPATDISVLYMWGTADPTHALASAKRARQRIPRLQDIAIEGRGHWLMIEAKEEVSDKVDEWLKKVLPYFADSSERSKL